MMQLQQDELSLPARLLVPMLRGLHSADKVKKAAQRLLDWDFVLDRDSVPAAIYVAWEKAVKEAVWELTVPREARSVLRRRLPLDREDHRVADGRPTAASAPTRSSAVMP